ncbi:NAD(P)-binding protein [Mollisia scopiformis]|uniref:NAD(P)-binding protein n=1 Tax=Mollisia scopiformis TaxID=149040 RepID=A0A194XAC8_MOLSC|nr:NAD(P)-binding protein [Mollisia scopiformis]KUJ17128.1 NAD(P)-binding protein [Mollisia scopiformis]
MKSPNLNSCLGVASTVLQHTSTRLPLEGKLALITGASRGIGAAIARNLASKGSSIALNFTSDSSAAHCEALRKELESQYPVKCLSVKADIGTPFGPASLVEAIKSHFNHTSSQPFQIDIVINNAGVASNATIEEFKVEEFERMYRINVLGPLLLMQAVLPYLLPDRSGRIVNLSSISSTEGFTGQSVYGGTKAALEAMTRTWARELAERCTVNAINPGPVKTDMWDRMPPEHRGGLRPWTSHSPLAAVREGVDEEDLVRDASFVAGIVAMLCSEDSGWCTGQVVCANGGMRMAI